MPLTWDECLALSRQTTDHYGLSEDQRKLAFEYALGVPPGGVIVELGVCNGPTSIVFAAVARETGAAYHGVDNFQLENTADGWRALMDRLALPYTLHVGLTNEVPWEAPIDLLLIDAEHSEPCVGQDCDRWLPFVKPGGVAMFHDYDGAVDPSSGHWAVREAVDRWLPALSMEIYWQGLLITRTQPSPMPIFDVTLAPDPVDGGTIFVHGRGPWRVAATGSGRHHLHWRDRADLPAYELWRESLGGTWKMQRLPGVPR